ncbi:flavin-containing monooxygenase FMO GS-OX4-like isoform X2 [Ischnura elegans]|uniref:flavin-containing monooxygenase FMO GS-OX4-like isoform X2 n=1 Tax=Ischnura elegans TaxID=197161 RepID=UPI001ED87D2F|nr:flavin-containing monooxygenase FMO GS-OX4-like isoform X2 [Ischnura elegans]
MSSITTSQTNLPKEVMQFLDFPFPECDKSFLHHSDVCRYLKKYAEKNRLRDHIQFFKKVKEVRPENGNGAIKWLVKVVDLPSGELHDHIFDYVMVCTGHYSEPRNPVIPGIESFRGIVMHSHEYRIPDPFRNKRLAVLGASTSGVDISIEVSSVAKEVFLCHRLPHKMKFELPDNVKQLPSIVSAFEGGFVLEDGRKCEADMVLFCTGYQYNFPFLSSDCKIQVIDNRVVPLYKHIINIEYPTMCFIGLPFIVLPFVMFDYQVQFFIKTLDLPVILPSKEEMEKDSAEDLKKRIDLGMPSRYAHKLDYMQWEYFEYLAKSADIPKPPVLLRKIYEDVRKTIKTDVMNFKTYRYEIVDNANFRKFQLCS